MVEKLHKRLRKAGSAKKMSDVKRHLEKGEARLARRAKLLLIADSSDTGWKAVEAYGEETFGSNSDDDRRIRRAKTAARSSQKLPTVRQPFRPGRVAEPAAAASSGSTNKQPAQQPQQIKCFGCQGFGHIRAQCPNLPKPR